MKKISNFLSSFLSNLVKLSIIGIVVLGISLVIIPAVGIVIGVSKNSIK